MRCVGTGSDVCARTKLTSLNPSVTVGEGPASAPSSAPAAVVAAAVGRDVRVSTRTTGAPVVVVGVASASASLSVSVAAAAVEVTVDAVLVVVSAVVAEFRPVIKEPNSDARRERDSVPLTTGAIADARLAEAEIVDSALSKKVEVSDIVTETGGAVVTASFGGGWSVPSTSSGLKMLMRPLQAEMSCLSRENTGGKQDGGTWARVPAGEMKHLQYKE